MQRPTSVTPPARSSRFTGSDQLQSAINAIHLRFGDHALVRAARLPAAEPWMTGQMVDRLSGIGGLPRGRVSVLEGPATSGKLSFGLALLALATRAFAQIVVIDPAHGFDLWMLESLGSDLGSLAVVRPPAMAVAEAAVTLARAGAGFLLLLGDGLQATPLVPRNQEAMWSGLEGAAARSGSIVVAVVESAAPPLAYASSLTLQLGRAGWLFERGVLTGLRARVICTKNKLAAPGASGELEVRWPLGARAFPGEVVRETRREVTEAPAEEVRWEALSAAG